MFTANIQIKVVRDKYRGTILLEVTSDCYWKAEISVFPFQSFQLISCKFMIAKCIFELPPSSTFMLCSTLK